MNIKLSLLLSLISGLSTMIGALLIFINTNKKESIIEFSLSLSMSIMLLTSLFELIPDSFKILINNFNYIYSILIIILTLILGYLTLNNINELTSRKKQNNLVKIGVVSMISLMIHNFPEGIAVFIGSYTNIKIGLTLFLTIMLHNIPEGISIAIPLYYGGKSRGTVLFYTLIASLSEPLGALLAYLFLKKLITNLLLSFILLFAAGLMINLSIKDLFDEIKYYNNDFLKCIGFILGLLLFILIKNIL